MKINCNQVFYRVLCTIILIASLEVKGSMVSYAGPWQYTNGILDRINIPGGYIKSNNVYFYINDHQRNIRQVWNASTDKIVQDNHYYPYGSLFGESASTAYLNTLANPILLTPLTGENTLTSSNDITTYTDSSSPNTTSAGNDDDTTDFSLGYISRPTLGNEISNNAYRYGGKEWLTFRGLNAYDFTARLYDPSLGRFHNPDPLNISYPHLSPNLYCAANPINATDPSGMAVIFDIDGNYLDTSVEGFTGDVLIFNGQNLEFDDGTIYNFKTNNGYSFSNFTVAFLMEYLTPYKEANLSISEQVSIWNNIVGHFEGLKVFDETFSMSKIQGGKISHINEIEYDNTTWATIFRKKDTNFLSKPIIAGTDLTSAEYDVTVENIASSVIVHEWYTHGMKNIGFGDNHHYEAYINVIKYENLWRKTTTNYKGFIVRQLNNFLYNEQNISILNTDYKDIYLKYYQK